MKKSAIVMLLVIVSAWGGSLGFESGVIKTHTEVFGDSKIDPVFKKMQSHLRMEDSPASLRGIIELSMSDFVSDNPQRDEHMHKAMESDRFPKAEFEIRETIPQGGDNYLLRGTMTLHGVCKPISLAGSVAEEGNTVRVNARGEIRMSDFGIKPPGVLFLRVRDQVDLSVDVVLKR